MAICIISTYLVCAKLYLVVKLWDIYIYIYIFIVVGVLTMYDAWDIIEHICSFNVMDITL